MKRHERQLAVGAAADLAGRGSSAPRSGGFSLVEVLIAVLILALGLLGIGAVLPVIVREQRLATEATLGVSAGSSSRAFLESRRDLNRLTFTAPGTPPTIYGRGWGVWLRDSNWSRDNRWEPLDAGNEIDLATGRFELIAGGAPAASSVVIQVADRIWPDQSGGGEPQFVWDFLGRRVATGTGEPGKIQVAIFVRRIDPNIRVARGRTLAQVITAQSGVPAADRRVAVAVDARGQPTRTGVGDYSTPRAMRVRLDASRRGELELNEGSLSELYPLVRQPGQKLVDNLGNVYTVRGVPEDDASGRRVLLEPAVPPSATETSLTQIAFTPQAPASVSVMTFTPLDP